MVKCIFFLICFLFVAEYASAQTFYPLAGSKLILGGGTSGTTQLTLKASPSVFIPYTITFPATTPTNSYILQTDGSGQLSWINPTSLGYLATIVVDAPLTGSGTSGSHLTFSNQTDNLVFASPDGGTGAPSFRSLTSTDIPNLNTSKLTAGTLPIARGGTGASTLTAHGVVIGNGTSPVAVTSPGTAGNILESGGSSADPSFASAPIGIYGDGSDGSLTYDGTTTILGMAPVANVYTLTRDIFPSSMTVNNGVTIVTAGARVYCTGTITNSGTIHNDGGNANNNTAGAATNSTNILGIGQAGGAGGGTGGSTAATANAGGGAGGVGGISGAGQSAGAVGGAVSPVQGNGGASVFRSFNCANTGMILTSSIVKLNGGSGGSGGGGSAANKGGGGGGGGGVLLINAWKIDNTNGSISADGGAGGDGKGPNAGSGGGGGGGLVLLIYHTYTGNVATANGGAAGAAKTGNGVLGSAGNAGKVISLQN